MELIYSIVFNSLDSAGMLTDIGLEMKTFELKTN